MKRSDVLNLWNGLHMVGDLDGTSCSNIAFAYAVAKTKRALTAEIESIQEALKPIKQPKEYEDARLALCREHAKETDGGEPETRTDPSTGKPYYPMKDMAAFDKAWEELKEKHAEELEALEKQKKEQKDFMAQEVEVQVHQVDQADVPVGITAGQMTMIFDLVKDKPK